MLKKAATAKPLVEVIHLVGYNVPKLKHAQAFDDRMHSRSKDGQAVEGSETFL